MRILVQFSGGKDSQASLIWAVEKYGNNQVEAVFCDTGWEHPKTYKHVKKVVALLGVRLHTLRSKKYVGFKSLIKHKKVFPRTKKRFCTEELKIKPFIDFILDQVNDHCIVIQGIRAQESSKRGKMQPQCRLFKYYTTPCRYNKKGKPVYHSYRKKAVKKFTETFADDIVRPVFDWSAMEVIQYILKHHQEPNPLYKEGFSRVGCFPCIMARHNEIKQISNRYPERIQTIEKLEQQFNTNFFAAGYIPNRCCSNTHVNKNGELVRYPSITDVVTYLRDKNQTLDMFDTDLKSCMSFYNLCE